MITKKTKYALKALQLLIERYHQKSPVLISEISKREQIPKKFLEAILLELKDCGILASKKGKGGGYFLGKPPEKIRVSDVLRALEGPLAPLPCLSKTAHQACDDCHDEHSCGIKKMMHGAYEAQIEYLEKTTLRDFSDYCCQTSQELNYSI